MKTYERAEKCSDSACSRRCRRAGSSIDTNDIANRSLNKIGLYINSHCQSPKCHNHVKFTMTVKEVGVSLLVRAFKEK
jgi:hypothetical protein